VSIPSPELLRVERREQKKPYEKNHGAVGESPVNSKQIITAARFNVIYFLIIITSQEGQTQMGKKSIWFFLLACSIAASAQAATTWDINVTSNAIRVMVLCAGQWGSPTPTTAFNPLDF
jgi:hypothetical protein